MTVLAAKWCRNLKTLADLKKHLGWVAEEDLADGFVMGVAGLDLLGEGVDVAEAALEGAAGEDRVDAGGITGVEARLGPASGAMLMPKSKRNLRRHETLSDRIPFPAVSLQRRLAGKGNSLLRALGIFHKRLNENDISTVRLMILRLDLIFSLIFPVRQGMGRGAGLWATLEEHLGRVAEEDLADGFVMGVARLDLLRQGVDVAEAALEGAAGEDRVDAGGLVGAVGDIYGAGDRVGAGEAGSSAVRDVDRGCIGRRHLAGAPVDLGHRVDQIAAGGAEAGFGACHLGLDHSVVGEAAGAARGLAQRQLDKGVEHAAGDAERDRGDADRIEGLLREGVERAGLAAQGRVLARAGKFLGHEEVFDRVGFRRRAAQPDRVPLSSNLACPIGNSQVRKVGRPKLLSRNEPSGSTTVPCAPIQLACRQPLAKSQRPVTR